MGVNGTPVAATKAPVLEVSGYSLSYATPSGPLQALKNIDLSVAHGQTHGLVGESGSGKSSLAWAIMRYLPGNATENDGSLLLSGESLRDRTPAQILEIRGHRVSMVFQDPSTSLNPAMRLGEQLSEVLIRHRGLSRQEAMEESEAALARTGITKPKDMLLRYPHEASGGEKQRVVIAAAFACNPELIVFDEPTTALDVITAHQILDLFSRLQDDETDRRRPLHLTRSRTWSRESPMTVVGHRGGPPSSRAGPCAPRSSADPRHSYTQGIARRRARSRRSMARCCRAQSGRMSAKRCSRRPRP